MNWTILFVKSIFMILDLQEFIQPKRLASGRIWVYLYFYFYTLDYVVLVFQLTERETWELRVDGLEKVQEVLGGYHYQSTLLRNSDSSLNQEDIPTKFHQLLKLFDINAIIESFNTRKMSELRI